MDYLLCGNLPYPAGKKHISVQNLSNRRIRRYLVCRLKRPEARGFSHVRFTVFIHGDMSEKAKKQDRRTRYTRQTIKDTFLELLKQKSFTKITVTEVCKNAEINRGTFYLHYYDIYDVLSDIFNDMTQDMLATVDHLFCLNQKSCSYPFCQKIQMESQYRALFLDDAIAPILLEKIAENTKEGYVTWLMSHSLLTFEQAESVFYFQMNGCLSINRLMLRNHCNDWKQIQTVIDKFIKSGLESFLIHDQREENASDNFCSKISPTVTASSTLR